MKNPTPAMRQYLEIKKEHGDAILFFRIGDFYEMFFDDARCASRILGIALTSRDRNRDIPMCGVPYHAAAAYIAKLVKEGHKVAVCEQVTDPLDSKGIVERAVSRVITPGIALDSEILDPRANNFIAGAHIGDGSCGFSYMDVSTGEFRITEFPFEAALKDEIRRLRPLELVVAEEARDAFEPRELGVKKLSTLPRYDFDRGVAAGRLTEHFNTSSLDGFGCAGLDEGVRAAGALLKYIKDTQRSGLAHVRKCSPYHTDDYLILDHSTRRNLEITESIRSNGREGTLIEVLDRTRTAMGARRLKSWLLHPLKDIALIRRRQDAVEELKDNREQLAKLQALLSEVYDLERLMVRVSMSAANPRDLCSLKESLRKIPAVRDVLKSFSSDLLASICSSVDAVEEAAEMIESAIVDSPPVSTRDGGFIKTGYDRTLDELREIGSGGKDWILRCEARERAATGINSLKVGYNRVFGYYIEVTRANLTSVPPEYIRKQTLVNAERFVTPALKEWEERILTAEERSRELESEIFSAIVKEAASFSERVQRTADLIATLDSIASLSQAAGERGYARPEVNGSDSIYIEGGRHPVVEALVPDDFVANDLALDGPCRFMILTGPNMAGKSTYLRQNALIVVMAQTGSFVPASRASIGTVDRIFTRVGASDDLGRGQSTFMVEMNETANILNNATSRSLIILDEIGRGTSTFDGLSIAWAVAEYIHDSPALKAKTIFATHYHELTDLPLTKENAKNYNMAVKEWEDRIIFLRKVVPGGSNRSYGIQVARLAGIPDAVIERAREILRNLETGELNEAGMPRLAANKGRPPTAGQLSLPGGKDPVREELKRIDINRLTPLDALAALDKLKGLLEA
ncbi:MAG: DNA mismatch repair protein MutS [Deltaproteobacteria bacterium]|nr:DNA mismatch repair protein MutS [Deltaproteobacteria bacterium]